MANKTFPLYRTKKKKNSCGRIVSELFYLSLYFHEKTFYAVNTYKSFTFLLISIDVKTEHFPLAYQPNWSIHHSFLIIVEFIMLLKTDDEVTWGVSVIRCWFWRRRRTVAEMCYVSGGLTTNITCMTEYLAKAAHKYVLNYRCIDVTLRWRWSVFL